MKGGGKCVQDAHSSRMGMTVVVGWGWVLGWGCSWCWDGCGAGRGFDGMGIVVVLGCWWCWEGDGGGSGKGMFMVLG